MCQKTNDLSEIEYLISTNTKHDLKKLLEIKKNHHRYHKSYYIAKELTILHRFRYFRFTSHTHLFIYDSLCVLRTCYYIVPPLFLSVFGNEKLPWLDNEYESWNSYTLFFFHPSPSPRSLIEANNWRRKKLYKMYLSM